MILRNASFMALLAIGVFSSAPALALAPDSAPYVLLEKLVNINTAANNTDGLNQARAVLIAELEKLGFVSRLFDLDRGHRLLAFDMPGAEPKVLLVGHLDTVFKKDSLFQSLRLKDGKLYGPGIIDMKGGLVLIQSILAELKNPVLLRGIRVVVNDDEETGSTLSKSKLAELAKGIRDVLVFEPGLPDGAVVTSQSGVRWLRLSVSGKAAHAGLEPELGVNACVELAEKVVRLAGLTDFEKNLTVNIGVIEGGSNPNVVCAHASAMIDIRYREEGDIAVALATAEKIRVAMSVHNPLLGLDPSATFDEVARVEPLKAASSRELYDLIAHAAASFGLQISGRHVGYASDGNHLAALGHRVIVGLGPYGGGMHMESEFMMPESFDSRLKLGTALIRSILKKKGE